MGDKTCGRCSISKSATTEFYYKNKQTKDGLHDYCKVCKSNIHKVYLSNPIVYKRVIDKINEWRSGSGRDKYLKNRRSYDKSKKRILWRRRKYNAKPRIFKDRPTIFPDAK